MSSIVYTVGHSTHSIERLINLLSSNLVSMVADVRSHPYSRFNPQFNRDSLSLDLKEVGISYAFMGYELGARTEDPGCYVDGKVQYSLLARSRPFQKGLSRIAESVGQYRIALLCAEGDPLFCHRSILICRCLSDLGVGVKHILSDGRLESQEEALNRLRHNLGLGDPDLFKTREQLIAEAYDRRGQEIAYTSKDLAPNRMFRKVSE